MLLSSHCLSQAVDTIILYYDIDAYNASTSELEKIRVSTEWEKVNIISYTDYLGSNSYNKTLSERRARAARSRLIQRGLSSAQINLIEGKGMTGQILNSSEGILENRRTEIIVWKKALHKIGHEEQEKDTLKSVDSISDTLEESFSINSIEGQEIDLSEKIQTAEIGSKLVVDHLSFFPGQHYLFSSSYATLDKLAKILLDDPNLEIAIEGHICCEINLPDGLDRETGTRTLSTERAKYVYDQLIDRGVEKERLSYEGFGRKYPIYPYERNEIEKQANRRVEIKITNK